MTDLATVPAIVDADRSVAAPKQETDGVIVRLVQWCIAHRRRVVLAWLAIAILTTVVAGSLGNRWATNFTLPGTESQRAFDLLGREFKAESGDEDTIVFHVARGTIYPAGFARRSHRCWLDWAGFPT